MTTRSSNFVRVHRDDVDCLITFLAPLEGAIWLVTDLTTHIHWTLEAKNVEPVVDTPDGRFCRAFGLLTICDRHGEPVFLINDGDTIDWIEPDQILAVCELGDRSCEMRFERLEDLDVHLLDVTKVQCNLANDAPLRKIAFGSARFLQIYDDQLPTGDDEADEVLRTIEATIEARRRLIGPAAGTLDVMDELEHILDVTIRGNHVRSYIWAAVLREQIDQIRQTLAA